MTLASAMARTSLEVVDIFRTAAFYSRYRSGGADLKPKLHAQIAHGWRQKDLSEAMLLLVEGGEAVGGAEAVQ